MSDTSGFVCEAWLASAGMTSAQLRSLISAFGSASSCYEAFLRKDPDMEALISPRIRQVLEQNASGEKLRVFRLLMEKHRISVIRKNDALYPESLKNLDDPPAFLFFRGNPECLNNRLVSMVGSRAASYTGQKAARKLAEGLSRHGVTVVSGLASGIDACAHLGCLEGGSATVAVTGCGLDRVYPADNAALHERILAENGLILSEYAPGEKPAGWHFPVRNRIITGLSRALILVEAKIRSGSMTSVRHALEQGKDVFVYPGDPDSEYFEGNRQLLREGGIFFTGAEDILEDLHWLDNPSAVRQNSDCSKEVTASSPEEAAIIVALKPGALGFEQLLTKTGLDPSALMSTLTIMQIKGQAEALPGKIYQLRH